MRIVLFLLCLSLYVKLAQNSQCQAHADLAGHCGCCPLIGGSCIHYNTIDGIDVSWHLCVPESRKDSFELEQCIPKVTLDRNNTRLCRTKNETFRLFPQCSKKRLCFLSSSPSRNFSPQCNTTMAVKGSCNRTIKRYSYDSQRNECVPFMYSGCGGTTNRFMRLERCKKICIKPT